MTIAEFSDVFALLANQLRATDVDEATIRAYYTGLQDLDLEFVALAAKRLGRECNIQDGAWFPKVPIWRAMAGTIEGERAAALQAVLRKLPTPLCLACEDTGWVQTTSKDESSSSSAPRWKHCDCRTLRRLEILGRRPMPALPEKLSA